MIQILIAFFGIFLAFHIKEEMNDDFLSRILFMSAIFQLFIATDIINVDVPIFTIARELIIIAIILVSIPLLLKGIYELYKYRQMKIEQKYSYSKIELPKKDLREKVDIKILRQPEINGYKYRIEETDNGELKTYRRKIKE